MKKPLLQLLSEKRYDEAFPFVLPIFKAYYIEQHSKHVKTPEDMEKIQKILDTMTVEKWKKFFGLIEWNFGEADEIAVRKSIDICGSDILEEQYEKFFYTDEEYLDILKVRKKSIQSMNDLLERKNGRMKNIHSNIEKDEKEIERIKKYIADLSKDVTSNYNSAYVRQLDERERELNARISELQQAEELAKKRDTLVSEVTSLRNQVESLKIKVDVFLNSAKEDMLNKKKDFDEIYSDLMQRADGQCYSAYIGEDYLPHINMGQYRERSASVPKRLMYFLTLLIESLKNDINFPRFLMIDTPNKEGIDKDNLIKNIALLTEADKYNYENKCPFQIILTTGIDTYPEDYKKFVFFKLEGEKYLLQENILEEKC